MTPHGVCTAIVTRRWPAARGAPPPPTWAQPTLCLRSGRSALVAASPCVQAHQRQMAAHYAQAWARLLAEETGLAVGSPEPFSPPSG